MDEIWEIYGLRGPISKIQIEAHHRAHHILWIAFQILSNSEDKL